MGGGSFHDWTDDHFQRIVDEAGARVLRPDEVPGYIEAKARGFASRGGEGAPGGVGAVRPDGSEAEAAAVAQAQARDAGHGAGKPPDDPARPDKQVRPRQGLKRALAAF